MGQEIIVIRNDEKSLEEIELLTFSGIVISPGPGIPNDSGILMELIERWHTRVPILGICLGHQALGIYFGAYLIKAPYPMHGKVSSIKTISHPMWDGLPHTFDVCRYHSLVLEIKKEDMPIQLIREDTNQGLTKDTDASIREDTNRNDASVRVPNNRNKSDASIRVSTNRNDASVRVPNNRNKSDASIRVLTNRNDASVRVPTNRNKSYASISVPTNRNKSYASVRVPTNQNISYASVRVPTNRKAPPLLITAGSNDDKTIMAFAHQTLPIWGIQFHPEAILTQYGIQILNNWLKAFILH